MPGMKSRFSCRACKADFHAGHVEPDFMPGMKCGSTERRLGWDENKSHAGHEISIFMPGMIEISCLAWTFFVSNPVFSRSLGTDCPWAKSRASTFPKHACFSVFKLTLLRNQKGSLQQINNFPQTNEQFASEIENKNNYKPLHAWKFTNFKSSSSPCAFFFQKFVSPTQVHMPTQKKTQLPNLSLQTKIK